MSKQFLSRFSYDYFALPPRTVAPYFPTLITNNSVPTPVGSRTPEDHPRRLGANTILRNGNRVRYPRSTPSCIFPFISTETNLSARYTIYIFLRVNEEQQRDDLILTCIHSINNSLHLYLIFINLDLFWFHHRRVSLQVEQDAALMIKVSSIYRKKARFDHNFENEKIKEERRYYS